MKPHVTMIRMASSRAIHSPSYVSTFFVPARDELPCGLLLAYNTLMPHSVEDSTHTSGSTAHLGQGNRQSTD